MANLLFFFFFFFFFLILPPDWKHLGPLQMNNSQQEVLKSGPA